MIFAHCMHFMGIDFDIFHYLCKCFLLTCNEVILAAFQFGALVVDLISCVLVVLLLLSMAACCCSEHMIFSSRSLR